MGKPIITMQVDIERITDRHGAYYIATGHIKADGNPATGLPFGHTVGSIITQGKNEEELFMMIGDACLTVLEVRLSWWNRLVHKLFIF